MDRLNVFLGSTKRSRRLQICYACHCLRSNDEIQMILNEVFKVVE